MVETGSLSLRYVDGAEIVIQNIKPDDTFTKTIYVANTGTLDAMYNLIWQELTNEIIKNEMLIKGTCTRINGTTKEIDGTCEGVDSIIISNENIKRKVTIEPNIVHKYDLTITFKETNTDQNYNQGKNFNGVIGIKETPRFEKDSWDTISNNVKNGNISIYKVGDTREVDLGDFGKHIVRLSNNTTSEECSTKGFSQTACGFVVEFEDIITTHIMNPNGEYDGKTYNYGWNFGGWPGSNLYSYLQNDIYEQFPTDLKNIIIDTRVISNYGSSDESNYTTDDKLYLLSPTEIYAGWEDVIYHDYDTSSDFTRLLDYYNNLGITTKSYTKAFKRYNSVKTAWWLRSAHSYDYYDFYTVIRSGDLSDASAYGICVISPAFRIG